MKRILPVIICALMVAAGWKLAGDNIGADFAPPPERSTEEPFSPTPETAQRPGRAVTRETLVRERREIRPSEVRRIVRTVIKREAIPGACHDVDEAIANHLLITDRALTLTVTAIDASTTWPPDYEEIAKVRAEIIELGDASRRIIARLRTSLPKCR